MLPPLNYVAVPVFRALVVARIRTVQYRRDRWRTATPLPAPVRTHVSPEQRRVATAVFKVMVVALTPIVRPLVAELANATPGLTAAHTPAAIIQNPARPPAFQHRAAVQTVTAAGILHVFRMRVRLHRACRLTRYAPAPVSFRPLVALTPIVRRWRDMRPNAMRPLIHVAIFVEGA